MSYYPVREKMSKVPPGFAGKQNFGRCPPYHLASCQLHGSSLLCARARDNGVFRQHADCGTEQRAVSNTSWFGENNPQEPEWLKNYQKSNLAVVQKTKVCWTCSPDVFASEAFIPFQGVSENVFGKRNGYGETAIYSRGTVYVSVIEFRDAKCRLGHPIHLVTEGRKALQSEHHLFPFSFSCNISD